MLHRGEFTSFLLIHFFPVFARSLNCCTSSRLFWKRSSSLWHSSKCRSAVTLPWSDHSCFLDSFHPTTSSCPWFSDI